MGSEKIILRAQAAATSHLARLPGNKQVKLQLDGLLKSCQTVCQVLWNSFQNTSKHISIENNKNDKRYKLESKTGQLYSAVQ